MKFSRSFASLATATAVAFSGLALMAPAAHATVAAPTATTIKVTKPVGNYGDNLGLYISSETHTTAPVNGSDHVWAGTAFLQRKANGSTTWTNVASDTSPGYQYFENIKFTGNATYRVYYQGTFYDDYPEDVTYGDSYSPEVYVKTLRNLSVKDVSRGGKVIGKFHASPNFGGHKFVFKVKTKSGWKLYKRVKASSTGTVKTSFAATRGKRTYYQAIVPGDKTFTTVTYKFYATKY